MVSEETRRRASLLLAHLDPYVHYVSVEGFPSELKHARILGYAKERGWILLRRGEPVGRKNCGPREAVLTEAGRAALIPW